MTRHNLIEFEYDKWLSRAHCPECDEIIVFEENSVIDVNCETKQEVRIPGLYGIFHKCKNPFCKWSKIQETQ